MLFRSLQKACIFNCHTEFKLAQAYQPLTWSFIPIEYATTSDLKLLPFCKWNLNKELGFDWMYLTKYGSGHPRWHVEPLECFEVSGVCPFLIQCFVLEQPVDICHVLFVYHLCISHLIWNWICLSGCDNILLNLNFIPIECVDMYSTPLHNTKIRDRVLTCCIWQHVFELL